MSKAYKSFRYEDSTALYCIQIIKINQFGYQVRFWSSYPELQCYEKILNAKDILRTILQKYTYVEQGIETQVNTVNNSTLASINQLLETALQNKKYAFLPDSGIFKVYLGRANFLQIYTGKSSSLPNTLQIQFCLQKNKLSKQENMRTYIAKQLKIVYQGIDDIKGKNGVKEIQQNKKKEIKQQEDEFQNLPKQVQININPETKHQKTFEQINSIFQDINTHAAQIQKLQQKIKSQITKIKQNSKRKPIQNTLKKIKPNFEIDQEFQEQFQIAIKNDLMEGPSKKQRQVKELRESEEQVNGRKRVNVDSGYLSELEGDDLESGDSIDPYMMNKVSLYRTPNYESQTKKNYKGERKRPLQVSKSKSYAINTSVLRFILNPFSNPSYFKVQGNKISKIQHSTGPQNDKGLILDHQIILQHNEKKTIKFRIAKHENTDDEQNSGIYLGIIIKTYAVNYPDEEKVNLYSSFGELHSEGQSSDQGSGFKQGSIVQIIISKNRIEWSVNKTPQASIQKNIKRICTYYPIIVIRHINDAIQFLGES